MAAAKKSIAIVSPAKLNLHLRVLGKRPDGYHDLRMINLAVDLADRVEMEVAGEGIEIRCDHPGVPLDEENLCHRAARAFFIARPKLETGLVISIDKQIPVAGGMGGGSSNAAAVLFGLNRLAGSTLSPEELIETGASVSADVPFFLFRSPAWVEGKGEVLRDGPEIPDWTYLVLAFDFGVKTSQVFSQWDLTRDANSANLNYLNEVAGLTSAGPWTNDLESVVVARHPIIAEAKKTLIDSGSVGALMSGSGPTVFGIFTDERSAQGALKSIARLLEVRPVVCNAVRGPVLRDVIRRNNG